jgi:Cdc6-like AAA superfamily ATPase
MPKQTKQASEPTADSPTTKDLLGFKRFVEPIARRIAYATDENTPLTIGVYGEWGSGKTSFLQMIDEELQKQDIYPIWFNAWKYDQEDNLWSALIQTILDQARVQGKWYRRAWVKLKIWRDNIDLRAGTLAIAGQVLPPALRVLLVGLSLLIVLGWGTSEIEAFLQQITAQWFSANSLWLAFFQVNVVKATVAIIGFFAAKPDELIKLFDTKLGIDFSKFSRTTSYRAHIAFLDEFSREFKRIMQLVGSGKPIVVIIDDLDRCLPEKAIQVLEAIKLFLDAKGCVFLLAVDRDVVEKAIAVKYKELLAMAKDTDTKPQQLATFLGENYFEKIVQLPISLPPLSEQQISDFVTSLYTDGDIQICSNIFAAGLPRNPRKVKRLLQTFSFLRDLAAEDITEGGMKPSLLAKLVIIQSQLRRFYEVIVETPSILPALEKYYRQRTASSLTEPPEESADPILREKVEAFATQYPLLRKILLQSVSEEDTFAGINLDSYIFLVKPIAETKAVVEQASQESTTLALGRYLRQVTAITQFLSIRGIPSASSARLNIENVFVARPFVSEEDLAGSRTGPFVSKEKLTWSETSKRVSLAEMLKQSARTVVLGDPGSGKTTLLQYLTYVFASAFSQDDPKFTADRLGVPENLLPIFIPLREYGQYLEKSKDSTPTPAGFLEFLDNYFTQWNIDFVLPNRK